MKRPLTISIFAIIIALPCIVTAQPPGGGRGPGGRGPGGGSPLEMMSQMFDMADANRDGQLTKAELTAAMSNQRGGNQRGGIQQGRGGPPPGQGNDQGQMQRGEGGQGGPGGPPPRPGQVLPDFVAESFNLTLRQQRQLTALQADVDKRMAAMLTDEQKQQLENHHQQGPHGAGRPPEEGRGQGGNNGRPQRPQ